jgi:hypothetical protein
VSDYFWVLSGLSVGLLVAYLLMATWSWQQYRDAPHDANTEHGMVVSGALLVVCTGLVLTAGGQAIPDDGVLIGGGAIIRGALLITVIYLLIRRPRRTA